VTSATPARLHAFVRRHTRLTEIAGLPGLRLHTADDVMALLSLAGAEVGDPDPDLPYWAWPWAGGLAIARYLVDHPDLVAGATVLDVAAGSGICGIVAARLGAARVIALDRDPLAGAAIGLNARANGVDINIRTGDAAASSPAEAHVILAGDVCYQEQMAGTIVPWLCDAAGDGRLVLLGDPGRAYLPPGLTAVAAYQVPTSRELEPAELTLATVYRLTYQTARWRRLEPASG
jgi:predicted nicotinamide N-methyase